MSYRVHPSVLPVAALIFLTLICYWPGLNGRFIFDDYQNITANPLIHMSSIDRESVTRALRAYEPGSIGRPLATLSLASDYYRGNGSPRAFKETNLAIHLANALLVYLLARRLLNQAGIAVGTRLTALAIAAAWSMHPMHVSSVFYVVQRMEILSVTFVLAALLAYVHGRNLQIEGGRGWAWLALSILLAGVGVLSKESAVLFPAFAFALELTLFRFSSTRAGEGKTLMAIYLAGIILAVSVFVIFVLPYYADPAHFAYRNFSMGERLLTQLRILPMYLGQILLPAPDSLVFYYDQLEPSRSLWQPWTTAAGGLMLACLVALALRVRRNAPLVSLGILWFFAAHIITSNVLPLELAFEHRNYFAALGPILVLTDLIRRIPSRDGPEIVRVGAAVLIAGLMALCWIRSATWGNSFVLASDLAARNPMSARAAHDLGVQWLVQSGNDTTSPQHYFAQMEFERASTLPSASILPEQALILLAASAGKTADQKWWERLISKLETRPVGPQDRAAISGLLENRNEGFPIDDSQLSRAYETLSRRTYLEPAVLAAYGDHALYKANNPKLGEQLFLLAVQRADPDYVRQLIAVLASEGQLPRLKAVVEAAEEKGAFRP